jgi:hypothetical protein
MTRKFGIVGSVIAAALTLAAFTGVAFAGNGNGNGNAPTSPGNSATAPGQVKKDNPAPQPAAQAQPQAQATQTQSAKPGHGNSAGHGNSGKGSSSSAGANAQPSTPGMKPANNTAHGTSCTTGKSASGVTCASTGPTTAAAAGKSDASKRYGNGKTAAQIATQNGAPAGTKIFGPGNSQPHKVTSCKHPLHGNGGGVDVHAVKDYSNLACTTPAQQPTQQVTQTQVCGAVTTTTTSTQMQRGHAYGLLKHGKSLHSKTVTVTVTLPTGQVCAVSGHNQQKVQQQVVQVLTQALGTAPTQQQIVAATQSQATKSQASAPKSGVLGATFSQKAAKAAAKGGRSGVLGAVATVGHKAARGTLPFTGFPIWAALLIGVALIAAGLALARRRAVRDVV